MQRFLVVESDPAITFTSYVMLEKTLGEVVKKFAESEKKHEWKDKWREIKQEDIRAFVDEHVRKGDPRDVVIYCLFAIHFGWQIGEANAPHQR